MKIGRDFALVEYLEKRIADDKLSPGAVLGEIKRKGLPFETSICKTTLYTYIEKGVFFRLSVANLPMKQRKVKHKRKVVASRAPKGVSIEQRPIGIAERNSFGHWEMDCVCGSSRSTLLVLSERLTRKEIIFPMKNQKAESVIQCLNRLERQFGKLFPKVFKSITVDNGSEFADYNAMERSRNGKRRRTTVYYCHPYSSYERGTNERLNREIRRRLPKGTDLSKFSPTEIQAVEDWVNAYPRGVLQFYSSSELFEKELKAIA